MAEQTLGLYLQNLATADANEGPARAQEPWELARYRAPHTFPGMAGARQTWGAGTLPMGVFEYPGDQNKYLGLGLPQGGLDLWRSLRQGLGYEQDPNAPPGYVSEGSMLSGAIGGAGGAMTGTLGAGMARAVSSGQPRGLLSTGGAPDVPPPPSGAIRAYHGSPHDFDRFDLSRIGTGEGAQAFGHGLYFAENPSIAKSYKETLSRIHGEEKQNYRIRLDGRAWEPKDNIDNLIESEVGRVARAGQDLERLQHNLTNRWAKGEGEEFIEASKRVAALREQGAELGFDPGRLYTVNIKAKPEEFLDWDKPLSAQSAKVREVLGYGTRTQDQVNDEAEALFKQFGPYPSMPDHVKKRIAELQDEFDKVPGHRDKDLSGADLYRQTDADNYLHSVLSAENFAERSKALREAGIPGIRYLDRGSRGEGKGSYNYVLFDDSLVEIAHKYGFVIPGPGVPNGEGTEQPLTAVRGKDMAKLMKLAKRERQAEE